MADGTVIVGRIAVKVMPDTKGFKTKLRTQLRRIEESIKPVNIDFDVDEKALTAKVNAAVAHAEQRANEMTVKVNTDYDDSVSAAIRQLERELIRLGEEEWKIGLNAEEIQEAIDSLKEFRKLELDIDEKSKNSLERALARVNAEIDKMNEIRIDVALDEDSLIAAREMLEESIKGLEEEVRFQLKFDDSEGSLKRALAEVDRELEKMRPPTIDIKLDEESLVKLRERLQNELDAIEREAKAVLDFDNAVMRFEIERLARKIDAELNDITWHPKADMKDVGKALDKIEQRMWAIETIKSTITPEMDERAYREALHKIRNLSEEIDDLKGSITVDVEEAMFRRAQERLARLARSRIVQLIPVVSKTAATKAAAAIGALTGGRFVFGKVNNFLDRLMNLDTEIVNVMKLSTLFTTLSSSIFASASNVFALSAGLASLAPLLLSLPGILGGIAIGAGITYRALKDIKTIIPELEKGMSDLGDKISKNFWLKAEKPIKNLIDTVLPRLQTRIGKTSSLVGDWFGDFANAIGKSLVPALDGMFANLDDSIGIFKEATAPLAGIITSLGKMGSKLLPDLARVTRDWIKNFDGFLLRIQKDGTWDRWVAEAKQAFKDLGRIFKNTGKILADIARVANESGGAGLGTFADTLERIEKVTSGARFQTGLGNFFKGAHGFFSGISSAQAGAIGDLFFALSQTFANLSPQIGSTLGEFIKILARELAKPATQKAITEMFEGLMEFVRDIGPYVPNIVDFFRVVASAIGQIARENGDNIGKMFSILADIGKAITPRVVEIIGDLADSLAKLLDEIGAFVKEHPDAAAKIALLAIALGKLGLVGPTLRLGFLAAQGIVGWGFKQLLKRFDSELVSADKKIKWGKLTTSASSGIKTAFGKINLSFIGKNLATKILGGLGVAVTINEIGHALMPVVDDIAGWIMGNLPEPVAKAFATAYAIAMSHPLLKSMRQGIADQLDNIWPDRWPWEDDPPPAVSATKLRESLASLVNGVKTAVGTIAEKLAPLKEKFGTAYNNINKITNGALDQVVGTVKSKTTPFVTAGGQVVDGLKNSFIGKFVGAKPSVSRAAGVMLSGVKLSTQQQLLQVPTQGKNAGQGLANGLISKKRAVSSAASALGRAARPSVPNMFNSGWSIGSTFAAGIRAMVPGVARAALGLVNAASAYFPRSPAKEGPFSGKGWTALGEGAIGESFAEGLLARQGEVARAARQLMTVTKREFDGFAPTITPGFAPGEIGGLDSDQVAALSANRVNVTINNYNPVQEKDTTMVNRSIQRVATAGVI